MLIFLELDTQGSPIPAWRVLAVLSQAPGKGLGKSLSPAEQLLEKYRGR